MLGDDENIYSDDIDKNMLNIPGVESCDIYEANDDDGERLYWAIEFTSWSRSQMLFKYSPLIHKDDFMRFCDPLIKDLEAYRRSQMN